MLNYAIIKRELPSKEIFDLLTIAGTSNEHKYQNYKIRTFVFRIELTALQKNVIVQGKYYIFYYEKNAKPKLVE
jgi:purine nucleoside permease